MKTFRIIQGIAAAVGLVVAVALADNMQPSSKELAASVTLVVVCCLSFIGQTFYKEHSA
ncbi:hypothetical protein [Phocaeicola sp.]